MRKLILWNMISLDGYFEGPDKGSIDWFRFDEDLEKYILETQQSADTLLFGRITYEGMAAYWPSAEGQIADFMNSVPKVVFSRTLTQTDWNNTTIVGDNVPDEVSKLKAQPGGDIFVFGSADFSATLIEHGLVDEYRFGINPVLLGSGVPFFKGSATARNLTLIESKPFKSGLVILHYKPD
ncbi:MAG: dihydrofolate reductase family protein [Dehalococcoidia bacterium]